MTAQTAQSKSYFVDDADQVRQVKIDVSVRRGLPSFKINGLSEYEGRQARERVRAALVNNGFEFPLERITVEISPRPERRYTCCFDLAIAAAMLVALGELDAWVQEWPIYGEMGPDGSVRSAPVLAVLGALEGRERGDAAIVCPAVDASLVRTVTGGARAIPVANLRHLLSVPSGIEELDHIPRERESLVYGINRAQFRGVPDYVTDEQFDGLAAGSIDRLLIIDRSPAVPWDLAESVVSALGPPEKPQRTLLDQILLSRSRWSHSSSDRFEVMRPVRRAMDPLSPVAMKKTVKYSTGGAVCCPALDGEREVSRRALREAIDEANDVRLIAAVSSSLAERYLDGDAAAIQRVGELAKEFGVGPAGIVAPKTALAVV